MRGGRQWRGSSREPSWIPYRSVRHHHQVCVPVSDRQVKCNMHKENRVSTKDNQFHRCIFISATRLNNAPVSGFERDAGLRTTIRLIYPEGAPHSANDYKNTTMVALVVFKSLDLDWLTSVITKKPLVSLPHRNCMQKWCIT